MMSALKVYVATLDSSGAGTVYIAGGCRLAGIKVDKGAGSYSSPSGVSGSIGLFLENTEPLIHDRVEISGGSAGAIAQVWAHFV